MVFHLGVCRERMPFVAGRNEVLLAALRKFQSAVGWAAEDQTLSTRLKALFTCLQAFVLADAYELLVELISRELKALKTRTEDEAKDLAWLLRKFMIAVDAHVFLRNHAWSAAADSLFALISTFFEELDHEERIKILQNAFYLTLVGRFGRVLVPDYAAKFFDAGFSLAAFYGDVPVLTKVGSTYPDDDQEYMVESQERAFIELQIPAAVAVEKIESDALYTEGLFWANKLLTALNNDERSAVFKHQYLCLFDVLMAAAVNDPAKSGKAVDMLARGFDLVLESPFNDYFLSAGLMDFDHSDGRGLGALRQLFLDTEDVYKHQFFAALWK